MHRAELRLKGIYSNGKFSFVSQGHVLYSEDLSYLLYLEGGCDLGSFSAHLRAGGFFVDNWNDRIYVYERDAPGSFNVPAYYGRGGWTALAGAWELANWAKIYFRASYIKYFAYGNIQAKPDKVELSIQFRFRF